MLYKVTCTLLLIFVTTSCSHVENKNILDRNPAETAANCHDLVSSILLKENYDKDLQANLVNKKLISFSNKFVTIQHPRLDWVNRARISLNKSIKNWNNNQYPAFYIFNDEEVIKHAKNYFKTIDSMVTKDTPVADDANQNFEVISNWIKSFESYQKEVDYLLDERISLQYNLTLLKKLKLKEESKDIKLAIQRNGILVEEIVTLRKADKDLKFQIARLKKEIKDLDGDYLRNGRIKDRIIRQAMLLDMLTIVQRELEYAVKNTENPNSEILRELARLNEVIENSGFQPTTYGVYRITNQVFIRELVSLSKVDVAYKSFVEAPYLKIKDIVKAYIENHPKEPKDPNKIGFFKKLYAKITSITATQAVTGTGVLAVAGLGIERFFWIEDPKIEDISNKTELQETKDAHEEQINATKEVDNAKSDDHSSVIEIEISKLVN